MYWPCVGGPWTALALALSSLALCLSLPPLCSSSSPPPPPPPTYTHTHTHSSPKSLANHHTMSSSLSVSLFRPRPGQTGDMLRTMGMNWFIHEGKGLSWLIHDCNGLNYSMQTFWKHKRSWRALRRRGRTVQSALYQAYRIHSHKEWYLLFPGMMSVLSWITKLYI